MNKAAIQCLKKRHWLKFDLEKKCERKTGIFSNEIRQTHNKSAENMDLNIEINLLF
jgi:hypothetical protein